MDLSLLGGGVVQKYDCEEVIIREDNDIRLMNQRFYDVIRVGVGWCHAI